ncbi:MAG: DUF389 domain-containing protein [Candidatus Nanopelagicales bacterium]
MLGGLSALVLPDNQRRTLDELTEDLDLTYGDTRAKQSAFWTMLTLSAFIASAGVLSDSTATVIGAMIIAPLSTPIMGMALGVAKRQPGGTRRAGFFVLFGGLLVVAIGALFTLVIPGSYDLLGNPQISGRTSPGLLDLVAAVATGFAGAVALARRDVAAVLPGVAIAISLVPPLAVVGVCLGQASYSLAAGAAILFLSNILALVLAGTLVYTVLGYTRKQAGVSRRKAYLTISLLFVLVAVPLVGNTAVTYLLSVWTTRVETTANEWISAVPGATVESVDVVTSDVYIHVQTPSDLPPVQDLMNSLEGEIPNGIPVIVTTQLGQEIEAGTVGQ